MDKAINRKTGQIVSYHEVDGWSVGIHETDELLYGGDFITKYITIYDIEFYQNMARIYLDEFDNQEELRSEYFEKTNYYKNLNKTICNVLKNIGWSCEEFINAHNKIFEEKEEQSPFQHFWNRFMEVK